MKSVMSKIEGAVCFRNKFERTYTSDIGKIMLFVYSHIEEYGFVVDLNQNTAILRNYAAYPKPMC